MGRNPGETLWETPVTPIEEVSRGPSAKILRREQSRAEILGKFQGEIWKPLLDKSREELRVESHEELLEISRKTLEVIPGSYYRNLAKILGETRKSLPKEL